jgi:hypothetical protein
VGGLQLEGEVESPMADLTDSTTVMVVVAIWRGSVERMLVIGVDVAVEVQRTSR